MMRHRRTMVALCVLWLTASGCASPPSRYYTLSATGAQTQTPLPVSVAVGPVTIPAVVDSARIMVSVDQNELRPDDYNRWAAPLQDEIARAVAANLTVLLGADRVSLSTNTAGPKPEYRASIDVERFESVLGQSATLEAEWVVRRSADGVLHAGRTIAREDVTGGDYRALAAAHSRAVERLSADIAAAVRLLKGP